jgi:hypothetical protein
MQLVPSRTLSAITSFARVVIAKALHNLVPEWLEFLDDKRFPKGNPDIVNRELSAKKIFHVQ